MGIIVVAWTWTLSGAWTTTTRSLHEHRASREGTRTVRRHLHVREVRRRRTIGRVKWKWMSAKGWTTSTSMDKRRKRMASTSRHLVVVRAHERPVDATFLAVRFCTRRFRFGHSPFSPFMRLLPFGVSFLATFSSHGLQRIAARRVHDWFCGMAMFFLFDDRLHDSLLTIDFDVYSIRYEWKVMRSTRREAVQAFSIHKLPTRSTLRAQQENEQGLRLSAPRRSLFIRHLCRCSIFYRHAGVLD